MSFQNSSLFNKKKELLSSEFSKEKFSFSCNYHGISLSFNCSDQKFIKELEEFIPEDWRVEESKESIYVLFHSPVEYGISLEDWSDEESQDCFDGEVEKIGIQRDFAAKEISEREVFVIAETKISDGLFNFLRWFLSRKLIEKNVLIMHSSCIRDLNGNTHFFLGHSGAGKTTITSLSRSREVLGDDMNLLSLIEGEVFASPGAIGGSFSSDISYSEKLEVASFNWLEQSLENNRKLLTPGEARLKLIASVSNIFWESLGQEKINRIMNVIDQASSSIPCYLLSFEKKETFWNLIEK